MIKTYICYVCIRFDDDNCVEGYSQNVGQ